MLESEVRPNNAAAYTIDSFHKTVKDRFLLDGRVLDVPGRPWFGDISNF